MLVFCIPHLLSGKLERKVANNNLEHHYIKNLPLSFPQQHCFTGHLHVANYLRNPVIKCAK
jgi:hypothetical protein